MTRSLRRLLFVAFYTAAIVSIYYYFKYVREPVPFQPKSPYDRPVWQPPEEK
jgi:hypothetical protein